jgi:hypothetical protein
MRPRAPTDTPAQHHENGARQERQIQAGCAWGGASHSELPHEAAEGLTEHVIGTLGAALERLRDDANERDCRSPGVAKRRVATRRIPPKETFGSKPQPSYAVLSLRKLKRRGCELNDVGAPMCIEQVGTMDLVRECLAVIAIADDPIHGPRRWILDDSRDLSAAAAQFGSRVHDHSHPSGLLVGLGNTQGL